MTTSPFAFGPGIDWLIQLAVELVDRLATLVVVRRIPSLGAGDSCSLRTKSYTRVKECVRRPTCVPFRRFLWGVRREAIQRLYVVLHSTLGSHLRDALREGGAFDAACLPAPRA
jgi:hypothetical protein